jgi:hypothetical protein
MNWIETADERLAAPQNIKSVILGPSGVGKTFLCRSLPPADTLMIDGEAGTLALGPWKGDTLDVRKMATALGKHPWEVMRALACLLAGPDFSDYEASPLGNIPGPYSPECHAGYMQGLPGLAERFAKYRNIFADSVTVASRWSFAWSSQQPEALSEKSGKKDSRGIYGLHGREMVRWFTQMQHMPKNLFMVGILDQEKDDLSRITYSPQIEGGKASRELAGIFDQVMTLTRINVSEAGAVEHAMADGTQHALVCTANPWGVPGKDRSGCLAPLEKPDLSAILAKLDGRQRTDGAGGAHTIPDNLALAAA